MITIGKVGTFASAKNDKAQAFKVVEEACEVFGAWQNYDSTVVACMKIPSSRPLLFQQSRWS